MWATLKWTIMWHCWRGSISNWHIKRFLSPSKDIYLFNFFFFGLFFCFEYVISSTLVLCQEIYIMKIIWCQLDADAEAFKSIILHRFVHLISKLILVFIYFVLFYMFDKFAFCFFHSFLLAQHQTKYRMSEKNNFLRTYKPTYHEIWCENTNEFAKWSTKIWAFLWPFSPQSIKSNN